MAHGKKVEKSSNEEARKSRPIYQLSEQEGGNILAVGHEL